MAGELVPLVMIPRYSTFAGMDEFTTIAMDVTEYERAIVNVWRGIMPHADNTFALMFEEATDGVNWVICGGTSPSGMDPYAATGHEEQVQAELKRRWFRVRLALVKGAGQVHPVASCWAVGFLERRES